jgi:hypothetical protein
MMFQKTTFRQGWKSGGKETVCGVGSTLAATTRLRRRLPALLKELGINSINDAGCGDLNWILTLDWTNYDYLGVDVVERNSWQAATTPTFQVHVADICDRQLRPCDLTICRDVFIHLPNELIMIALGNFCLSSKYVLATSFDVVSNKNRPTRPGGYSPLNLCLEPFGLGEPTFKIYEKKRCKYLGLWQIYEERT